VYISTCISLTGYTNTGISEFQSKEIFRRLSYHRAFPVEAQLKRGVEEIGGFHIGQ
jgi:hypothetical protein